MQEENQQSKEMILQKSYQLYELKKQLQIQEDLQMKLSKKFQEIQDYFIQKNKTFSVKIFKFEFSLIDVALTVGLFALWILMMLAYDSNLVIRFFHITNTFQKLLDCIFILTVIINYSTYLDQLWDWIYLSVVMVVIPSIWLIFDQYDYSQTINESVKNQSLTTVINPSYAERQNIYYTIIIVFFYSLMMKLIKNYAKSLQKSELNCNLIMIGFHYFIFYLLIFIFDFQRVKNNMIYVTVVFIIVRIIFKFSTNCLIIDRNIIVNDIDKIKENFQTIQIKNSNQLFTQVHLQKIELFLREYYFLLSLFIIVCSFTSIEIWMSFQLKIHFTQTQLQQQQFIIILATSILFPMNAFLGFWILLSNISDKQKIFITTIIFGFAPLIFFTIYQYIDNTSGYFIALKWNFLYCSPFVNLFWMIMVQIGRKNVFQMYFILTYSYIFFILPMYIFYPLSQFFWQSQTAQIFLITFSGFGLLVITIIMILRAFKHYFLNKQSIKKLTLDAYYIMDLRKKAIFVNSQIFVASYYIICYSTYHLRYHKNQCNTLIKSLFIILDIVA